MEPEPPFWPGADPIWLEPVRLWDLGLPEPESLKKVEAPQRCYCVTAINFASTTILSKNSYERNVSPITVHKNCVPAEMYRVPVLLHV